MKNWILFILFSGLWPSVAITQLHFSDMGGGHFKGIGRAGVTRDGLASLYYNQAGLYALKDWSVDLSVERKFNLQDLNSIQIGAAKKFGFGSLGIIMSQFGTQEYNEQLFGLAYGRELGKVVSIGGLLAMAGYNSDRFGSSFVPVIALGSIIRVSKEFTVGVHVFNPVPLQITDNTATTARYRMGLAYQPSDKVSLMGEVDKDVYRDKWEFKMGVSYQVVRVLGLEAGFNPSADYFAFGIKYNPMKKLMLKGAGSVHQTLGLSPAISVSFGE